MARSSKEGTPPLFDLEPEAPDAGVDAALYVQVALNRPLRREFTYAVPERFAGQVAPGSRVAVPFGTSRQVGVVVGSSEECDVSAKKLRAVHDVLDSEPVVDAELLGLTRWIAERYAASWGEALAAVLPAPLKRERGMRRVLVITPNDGVGADELAQLEDRFPKQHRLLRTLLDMGGRAELRDVLRQLNLSDSPARTLERRGWVKIESVESRPDQLDSASSGRERPAHLSPAQERALEAIGAELDAERHATFLLEGVTGSGKTEVYLCAIERALAAGRAAIVLVPEIALTPQTVGWFRSRFDGVAVLHSRMTDAQRLAMWMGLKRGETRVVVGARSAIFAPVSDLGVIVVDEEHEPSFKQGSVPRYHARDVAVERARRAGAVCILGSATPSLESWKAARDGRFRSLPLPERVGGGAMPTVHVVDMRGESQKGGQPPLCSRLLQSLLVETFEAKEQAILFLNRRGFVPILYCHGCRMKVCCAQCSMSMTLHRRIQRMVCHGCCEETPIPTACPTCSRPRLTALGVGGEKVETTIARMIPGARIRRMDSDTMRRREDYEATLGAFGRGDIDVLVGTQMIAKGLDFPRVTLVGIVAADQSLHMPDFRAAERTYQLIAQVAGRAGRAELAGRIVIQTLSPGEEPIACAAEGRFEDFARWESGNRAAVGDPPHGRALRVVVDDTDDGRAREGIGRCANELQRAWGDGRLRILGPETAPIGLLRGRYRYNLLLRARFDVPGSLKAFAGARDMLVELAAGMARPRVTLDVDPVSMF